CGYDIIPMLYALSEPGGEKERKVRNDYYTVASQLYEETFFVQIADWCKQNRLELTGHIEEHYINHPGRQGQFFNNLRHLDIPGADCHDYRYRFPRKITYREPKFAVSTTRAYGKKRAMSEAFGGAGWGCSLQQYKRGVNTLGAMGISMITLHGFYSECDCQGTQADWPCSFFFQNPYWRYFKYFADYMNRICYMNAQGTPVVDVGIYYAIDEMQMEMVAAAPTAAAGRLNKAWNNAIGAMVENQIDADIIDEVSILNSDVSDGRIRVGNQAFRVLVCPDVMQASAELESKLEQFRNNGGKVVYYACNKAHDDGVVTTDELYDVICGYFQPDVKVIRGERDNLYVNHRKIEEQEVYFIGNSAPRARSMTLLLREKGSVQRLSPEDGKITDISFTITENGTAVDLWLEQDEACWLIVDSKAASDNFKEAKVVEEIAVAGKWEFLPINSDIEGEEQLKLKSTLLDIPLASFASQLHPDARQIRIKNTAHEEGHCGRHLSLWKASWVTRRLDWTDISMQEKAYFRRTFELDAKPTQARICIAAVNEWKMWINGKAVAESIDARKPSVIDIANHLTSGENVIAVEVVNHTPMEHFNLLSLDTLPPEEMISLIAQAEITVNGDTLTLCTDEEWLVNDHYFEGWQELSYKPTVHIAHSTNEMMFGGEDARWTQCWERGRPPMLP
ncbi:MAG: alpha-L-rhamnosidase N-terminal domain-containing protein, partial [Kiritimatiellae bacterium]|nr:alpha-L-rhamnosidase N-terminal domain-containing protein [Kiritimatiellia bacterium]